MSKRKGSARQAESRKLKAESCRRPFGRPPGTITVDVTTMDPPHPECPRCAGIMPADAIECTNWRMYHPTAGGAYYTRRVSMHCPHCDYCEQRTERRGID